MKKLLFVLLVFPLFISCSSDDNEEYKWIDVNLLNGKWETLYNDTVNGIYEFDNGTVIYNAYNILNGKNIISFKDRFRLTHDQIIYYGAITTKRQSYLIKDDSLFITDLIAINKLEYKYVKKK